MSRHGFTVIELLTVVAVILVLMGIGIPTYGLVTKRARDGATRQLVAGFAAAIARESALTVAVGTGAATTLRPLYDFNRDGVLDGQPALDPGFDATLRAQAASVGYEGAIAAAGLSLQRTQIDAFHRPLDAWSQPMRIAIASGIYGASPVGIWSTGRDKVDGTADDVKSW